MKRTILISSLVVLIAGAIAAVTYLGWLSPDYAGVAGKPIENTRLVDFAGADRSFEELRGRGAVVYFWASWCSPCKVTMAKLKDLPANDKLRKRFVIVALDDEIQAVKDAQARTGYAGQSWIATVGIPLIQRKFAGNDKRAVPYVVELDAQGTIVGRSYGLDGKAQLLSVLAGTSKLSGD